MQEFRQSPFARILAGWTQLLSVVAGMAVFPASRQTLWPVILGMPLSFAALSLLMLPGANSNLLKESILR